MKLLRSVVALSLLAAAGVSQAAVFENWGQHDELEFSQVRILDDGEFADVYSFTLAPNTLNDLTSSAVSLENKDLLDIVNGKVDLYLGVYDGDVTGDAWKGGFDFAGNTGANEYLFEGLTAGSYYYLVTGNATGTRGGAYQLSSSLVTAPIPEPETYAMLAAGLGAIVVARRAKKA